MVYEWFFAVGISVSAASLALLFYRGRIVIQVFAQKREIFGIIVLLTAIGFGVFAVSEILELLEIFVPIVKEMDLLASSILLLSQIILLALLVRMD